MSETPGQRKAKRYGLYALMSFATGAPHLLITANLQAWYTVNGIHLIHIGWMTLLFLPYSLKCLWAPLIDRFRVKRMHHRTFWVILSQLTIALLFVTLSCTNPKTLAMFTAINAFILAFISANLDISVDAYRIETLAPDEISQGTSWSTIGYHVGMLLTSSLSLILARHYGWGHMFQCMALLMILLTIPALLNQPKKQIEKTPFIKEKISLKNTWLKPWGRLWRHKHFKTILGFLILFPIMENMGLCLLPHFLLKQVHLNLTELAWMEKMVGMSAILFGSLLCGVLMEKYSSRYCFITFLACDTVAICLFYILAMSGKHTGIIITAIMLLYLGQGASSTALATIQTRLCDKKHAASQYALFAALHGTTRMIGPISAYIAVHLGWPIYFTLTACMSMPLLSFLFHPHLKGILLEHEQQEEPAYLES
jgi:MFS transporter, PAT family, beta-lactamase induction signal transducer AmpG